MTSPGLGPRRAWTCVAISFIIVGAGLRLLGFFSQGQLYIDDARLALNIASRSFGDLIRPLDYGQIAPIPFLWLERLITRTGGVNEYALRLFPLLAGIAVVALVWKVGRRALGEQPAAIATCLAAVSTFLMSYANAVKQYSSDALVTVVLVWLVLDVLDAGDRRVCWVRLALAGAAALWISHPAVFVLVGAAAALPVSAAVRAVPHWWQRYGLTMLVWIGAFTATYVLFYQTGERDAAMREFWKPTFLSLGAPDVVTRAGRAARAILVPPLVWPGGTALGTSLVLGVLTGVAFFAGLLAILRAQGPSLALLCAGPYVAVLGAALIGTYPPADRLLLFAAPFLFFIYASALRWGVTAFPSRAQDVALAAALVLLTFWRYPAAVEEARHPVRRRETRTLLAAVEARAPDAPVYLLTPGTGCICAVWTFYTTDWNRPDTARLRWIARSSSSTVESGSAQGTSSGGADAQSYRDARHLVLIGAGPPTRYVRGEVSRSPRPDPGWVERESDRIRSAANPVAWLWATEFFPENAIAHLLHGIRQRGGRLIFASRVVGATAWEVEFSEGARSHLVRDHSGLF
jgi:hypothetical protein